VTHQQFIRKYPEFSSLPEFIVGVNNRRVRLMEATYADCVAYQQFLARRIARAERKARVHGTITRKAIRR